MNKVPLLFFYLLLILVVGSTPAQAENSCNPVVEPASSDTTLVQTLTRLAEEYDFKLTLPLSLDRPVQIKKSMKLNQLVKYLTSNLNTVLKHRKTDSCATPVLTHIIVLPVSRETDYVSIAQPASNLNEDYIYIEDMESYVANVLSGKQNAELDRMTPEQQQEFDLVRQMQEAQLVGQSAQTPEN